MKYKVTLNGKVFEVEVEKGEAILLDEYAASAPTAPVPAVVQMPAPTAVTVVSPASANIAAGEIISAPLPGSIFAIKVKEGETVKAKQVLLVIEAMKMENEVLAPRDGKVVQMIISQGSSVESGAPLLVLG